ncbi:MAG: bifunctional oligoribonuclease/PAP phosphatase NrnA [Firmicutes bacterium]|nr:bifunctional oligoribonuclease/PAP phosphatase NrnA [Bacillota bacterium]
MIKFKSIYKKIKKYDSIVIARHMRVDPDALASELALKEIILNTFPNKKVYAVGISASKFKYMGELDKITEDIARDSLLIVLDTPDKKRVDVDYLELYRDSIKIDHHPYTENFCNMEYIDENASSTCEIILDLTYNTKLKLDRHQAELLFLGIVSDTNRFTTVNTSFKTFDLIHKLIKDTNIKFIDIFEKLYLRPLSEVKLQGYIAQNLTVTENGLAYIKINEEIIKEFGVDSASPGNMINNFNYINEIIAWAFVSEDKKNDIIRITIRSRGPVINDIAAMFNGGGHERASGARVKTMEEANNLIKELDNRCRDYRGDNNENK